jgi:hypothetical protein
MSDIMFRDMSSTSTAGTVTIWYMNAISVRSVATVGVVSPFWTIQSAGAE